MAGGVMREERKVVTALFADVVGSTEITERLDPEDARDLLGGAVRCMVEAVERFGGTVKDLAGDGVLALFGAPVAHEDDAERAVRAGLRIVEDLRRGDSADSSPSGLSVRVGIESGLVVLGPVGAGARVEYGATGDAINVAARLQSQAEPGSILVGRETQRGIREVFDWGDERRLELKGKSEPVSAFEVVGVSDRASRRAAGTMAAPLVGRSDELSRASRIANRALTGRGGLVLVVGEPGIGKSRLVEELRREVERSFASRWLQGQCVSFGRSTPYLPLRELVLDSLEIHHDEPDLPAALRRSLAAVAPDEIDEISPFLEAVLGVAGEERTRRISPETLQLRTLEALRALFARLAEAGPVVVSIEDLHWADPSSLQAIERLLPTVLDLPVLYVLTRRDREGPVDRLETLPMSLPPDRRVVIELQALPSGADGDLLDALAGGEALPAELRRRVVDTAGGNPFFIRELVRALTDSSKIAREGERSSIERTSATVELPTTVEKVIMARLDMLEPEPRDVLTAASVLGRGVSISLLEQVTGSDPRRGVDELLRLDLLQDEGRSGEVRFTHALIQEVAYGTLLKKRRRELHSRAASAIEELGAGHVEENLAVLAHHHHGAGDADAARRCHVLAAERAERLHAVEEALQHLSSAIELAADGGETVADRELAELFLARARIRARIGDVQGAKRDLEIVLGGADPDGAADLAMRAHDELGFVLAGAADYREAVPHLHAALDTAVMLEDRAAQVSALSRLALVHTNRLDFEAGLEYGQRAMTLAESSGDDRAIATAMDALKQVALETGDFGTLDRLAGRLDEIHRRNDDLWLLQFAGLEVGYADVARARLDSAFARLEESLAINRRIGDRGNEPIHVSALGMAHWARGDYGSALALERRAFALACELDHGEWIAWSAAWLGGMLLELGAFAEASGLLEAGIVAGERSAADMHLVRCLGLNAWATYQLGDRERGVELADRASSIFARIRVRPPRAYVPGRDAYAAVARVRIEQGLLEDATSLLEPIVAACEACGWSDGVVDGWLALGEVALRRGDLTAAVEAADRALAEAVRVGSPTAWRAHAALALAHRAAGADELADDHVRRAEELVAELMQGVDDSSIRAAFSASVAERLSAGRGGA